MHLDIYCVGMRVERFVGEGPGDMEYDFEPCENVRYRLFCVAKNQYTPYSKTVWNLIITLQNDEGWCGSGAETAVNGNLYAELTHNGFGPMTHKIRNGQKFKLENVSFDPSKDRTDNILDAFDFNLDGYDNDVIYDTGAFSYYDIGDEYYPNNWYKVNMDIFEELPRAIKKRPVWIFAGDSGVGKSTFGYYLNSNFTVYETDSAKNGELPSEIWADIVVLGNKWKGITLEDVKKRLGGLDNVEVIISAFEKGEKR